MPANGIDKPNSLHTHGANMSPLQQLLHTYRAHYAGKLPPETTRKIKPGVEKFPNSFRVPDLSGS